MMSAARSFPLGLISPSHGWSRPDRNLAQLPSVLRGARGWPVLSRGDLSVMALSALAMLAASWKAPALSHRLATAALPLVVIGFAAGAVSLHALWRRRYGLARGATIVVAGAIIWGWIVAQAPRLIGTHLTINTAAATPAALTAVAIAGGVVLLAVVPALFLLFGMFGRPLPEVIE
jgi:cytochrome bd-type quinol oxidase subunit 2